MVYSSKAGSDYGPSVSQFGAWSQTAGSRATKNYKLGLSVAVCISAVGWIGVAVLALAL